MAKFEDYGQCMPMASYQKVLSGKWKIVILWYIYVYKVRRFSELKRQLGEITQSTLTKQLRELENDGFIKRMVYPEVPPKVEYSLTEMGHSFTPVMEHMKAWSEQNLMTENNGAAASKIENAFDL